MTVTQPLTDQQLDDIEARSNAATDGPWTLHEDDGDTFRQPAWEVLPASGEMVARVRDWASADAAFIAHARTDVPALLAEIRRLRAELDAERSQHAFTLRQRNNRSTRLIHLRELAEAGDAEALLAAAVDVLAASASDHTPAPEVTGAPLTPERPVKAPEPHATPTGPPEALLPPGGHPIADADDPTPLRWGLDDVLWSDDDSVIVLMSGPDREPYWLELEADRAAVLRRNLAGPDGEQPDPLLRATEAYLSALHGSVGRHDNLAANFGCAGCELQDKLAAHLAAASGAPASPDTLPAWLYQRFAVIHGCPPWDQAPEDDRAYREHHGIPDDQPLHDDALRFHVRDEAVVIEFAVEERAS